ncbi:tetratricopeptide repeat protein 39B-like isoform X2 [Anthonomus grandis grandis]|nr:tetratricopeptide repeat protein 39B-like isoform X2 [Anthonomus grandis grandis]XP_050314254.1 tetratricopeptide repeat protein 39B-like isoform X2 [Anthonomus grandis grandis]XP_050314255.1 tetratricopeptide repeat protein 39B-like isoform X2 [Anthonomus grandis grandis]
MEHPVEDKYDCENDIDEENEDDSEEFEDACDFTEPVDLEDMTLDRALEESKKAIFYFFNNQFMEAKQLMTPYANVSMYHSLGHAIFLFLEAILTIEPAAIRQASKALKHALVVCNRFRKKNTIGESLGKMVKKSHYDQFNEMEAHAELCYAECLLLKSMLTFMEDETLSSFIKAGIKIRSCFNSYKECQQILSKRIWENEQTKLHFESGVKMGIGTFNLMISMLPSKIIKLLEFIGFQGNKEQGLTDLTEGYQLNGIRQILCTMTLLGYNLIVMHVLSHKEGDILICEDILDRQLKKHPDGVWFLFFQGRLEFMKGNLDESIKFYTRSWKSQDLWPQFHHVCFWELLWVHCLKCEWREALKFSSILNEESRWSKCLYTYQKAVIMIMLINELTFEEKMELENLMRDVPKYKQRIAGKSLPMEKFAIKKSERYFSQKKKLILPVLELMFMWNLLKIMKNYSVASEIMKLIDEAEADVESNMKPTKYDYDNKALVYLLKGACLRHMGAPNQAIDYFEKVISMQKNIVEDNYLVPYSIVELALVEWSLGNKEKAVLALEDAKKNYTSYSCESRLHFRIHTAMTEFKAEFKKSKR